VSIAASNVARSTERAHTIVDALTTDSLRPTPWREYDSLFALSSRVRGAGTAVDSEAAKRLVGWQYAGESVPSYLNAPTIRSPATPPQWSEASSFLHNGYRPPRIWIDYATVPQIARLAADTATPVLALFRRLARSAPLPPLIAVRAGSPEFVPQVFMQFGGYNVVASHNVAAGILALRQRDSATALLRAREIIAVARHMMRSPLLFDHLLGLQTMASGASLIQLTGLVMHDPARVAEARRLRVLGVRARADFMPWYTGGAQLLMADPVEPVLLRFLADTTLLPAARAAAAVGVVHGFCLSAREMLFGVDARRREVLERVGAALRNTPRMDDIILAERHHLDEWIGSPSTANAPYARLVASINLVLAMPARLRLGPLGMRARFAFCTYSWGELGIAAQQ
jgi:hypothetical protein